MRVIKSYFLDIEPKYREFNSSKFVILPVPYEKTTSYGKGTKYGPNAIFEASQHVENYDVELDNEPYKAGICVKHQVISMSQLQKETENILKHKKIPITIGGEHSISIWPVKACQKNYNNLSVLQFDAHADLRNIFHGRSDSHGCIARRILEVCPIVQVGIRSMSKGERDFAKQSDQWSRIHFADKNIDIKKILKQLSDTVYITFDVDVFDPSIVPATGTPEPGGLLWEQILNVLKQVIKEKNVVGMDFVELAPRKDDNVSDFTIAKLIYKAIGFLCKFMVK